MTLQFMPLAAEHVPAAAALAQDAYTAERRRVRALIAPDVSALFTEAITDLVQHGYGVAALHGGEVAGYMAFFGPFEHFFGGGTGAFSPLHGNATTGTDRARLSSLLFQRAAENLTRRGANTVAITVYSHDRETATALSLNGFGIRCADAIRLVDPPLGLSPVPNMTFAEVSWRDAGELLALKNDLVRHLRRSPTFVAAREFTPEHFAALNERRQSRFFVARDGQRPVGYLELADDGENVLTTAPDKRNICGAFLDEAYRGRDLYRNLLGFTLATLRDEGVRRVGVDFETMNPTALRFWTKDFTCYTYSYVRRIDKLE